jgi:hypothetical protein
MTAVEDPVVLLMTLDAENLRQNVFKIALVKNVVN